MKNMMNNKFQSILFISCCVLLSHFVEAQSNSYPEHISIKFAFISDTQSPMWLESLLVARNQNERGTQILLGSILGDSSLSAVLHFGDVTECSAKEEAWLPIDSFLVRAKKRNLPVYAAIGNHDDFRALAPLAQSFQHAADDRFFVVNGNDDRDWRLEIGGWRLHFCLFTFRF